MAISYTYQPANNYHLPAYRPFMHLLHSDHIELVNLIMRIKQYNPAESVATDLAVVRKPPKINSSDNFELDLNPFAADTLSYDLPDLSSTAVVNCDNSYRKYFITAEEEVLGVDGLLETVAMSYPSNAYYIHNSCMPHSKFATSFNNTYLMDSLLAEGKFLSRSPRTIYLGSDEYYYLQAIVSIGVADRLSIKAYDNGGTNILSTTISLSGSGHRRYMLPIGYQNMKDRGLSQFVNETVAYYNVRMENSTGLGLSEVFHFRKREPRCPNPIRLFWLNSLGAWDAYTFETKHSRKLKTMKESYERSQYQVSSINTALRETYSSQASEKWSLSTDNLRREEVLWLQELLSSPKVMLQSGTDLIAANIEADSFTTLNEPDRLNRLAFDLTFANPTALQRL